MSLHTILRGLQKFIPFQRFSSRNYPHVWLTRSSRDLSLGVYQNYKMYLQIENKYAYDMLETKGYKTKLRLDDAPPLLGEALKTYLQQNWSGKTTKELCEAFGVLARYCSENKICISNKMFDKFVDALTDNVCHVTDEELQLLFLYLKLWPETESVNTRNFIEVWAALDDACLARYKKWNTDTKLKFVALTFELSVTRSCEYPYKCVQKLTGQTSTLTVPQLVSTSFFLSVLRHAPLEKHNFELYLEKNFHQFTIEDIAIMSMGFFKSKSPIRKHELLCTIIEKIILEKENLEGVPLAALLKLVRYSYRSPDCGPLQRLMTAMEGEIPRISTMSCVHLALIAASNQLLHVSSLNLILERVSLEIDTIRLKDLERLLLTLATLNYHHPNIDFVSLALEQLRKLERHEEIQKYGQSYSLCVMYASILNYYPYDLINNCLDPKFIKRVYGEALPKYGRELLVLDNTLEINCPDYTGNRLSSKDNKYLAKNFTDYVPDENFKQQYNVSEKLTLEVIQTVSEIVGNRSHVCGDHSLPHYQRGDIYICMDKYGSYKNVSPHFPIKPFGPIKPAPTDDIWIAFVVALKNAFIKGGNNLTGPFEAKIRDHKKTGYHPVILSGITWNELTSKEEKIDYLKKLIKEPVKT